MREDNVPGLDDGARRSAAHAGHVPGGGLVQDLLACLDAGRSLYPSKLMNPMGPPHGNNCFDPKPEEVGNVGAQKNEVVPQKIEAPLPFFWLGSGLTANSDAVRFSIGKPTTSTITPRRRNCRR